MLLMAGNRDMVYVPAVCEDAFLNVADAAPLRRGPFLYLQKCQREQFCCASGAYRVKSRVHAY
jgi:hypothetical protein